MRKWSHGFRTATLGFLSIVSAVVVPAAVRAQDSLLIAVAQARGLSASTGWSRYVIRDDFISRQKYSGPMSVGSLMWVDQSETHAHRLVFQFGSSSRIRNNTVYAEITEGSLGLEFLYPTAAFRVLGRDVRLSLGPAMDFFLQYRQEKIAEGANPTVAGSWLGSLCFAGAVSWSLSSKISLDCSGGLALVGLAGKTQTVREGEAATAILTAVNATHGDLEAVLRYRLTGGLAIQAGYQGALTRIDEWAYMMSGRDSFIAGLTVDL